MSDEPSQKRQRVGLIDRADNCAICFESDKLLEGHGCATCKKDSWKICESCNESRLSRTCPICAGDYSPLILYAVPGKSLSGVRTEADKKERIMLMIKIKALGDTLIPAGNTLLWADGRAVFALPKSFGQPSDGGLAVRGEATHSVDAGTSGHTAIADADADAENSVAVITVPMAESELLSPADDDADECRRFEFKTSTWTMLEAAVEEDTSCVEWLSPANAAREILRQAISNPKAVLFLPLLPAFFREMEMELRRSIEQNEENSQ